MSFYAGYIASLQQLLVEKRQMCAACRVLAKNHITIVYEDSTHIQASAPLLPYPYIFCVIIECPALTL